MHVKGRKAKKAAIKRLNEAHSNMLMKVEMPLHVAYDALGKTWFSDDHFIELYVHSKIVAYLNPPEAVAEARKRLIEGMGSVVARKVKTGKLGVSGDDRKNIQQALDITIPWIMKQPNELVAFALKQLEKEKNK